MRGGVRRKSISFARVDGLGQFSILIGHLEQDHAVAVIDDANLNMVLAHRLDVVAQVVQKPLEVGGIVGCPTVVVIEPIASAVS
jgi:hypothetical protein